MTLPAANQPYAPKWGDQITVEETNSGNRTQRKVGFNEFRNAMNADPNGTQEVRVDKTISLKNLNAKFINALTVPAGAILKHIGLNITKTVVASGTTVKVGLGPNGSNTNQLGNTADLIKNSKITGLYPAGIALLGAPLVIDVNGVVTAGNALGSGNITDGEVRVFAVYETATPLASV